jgi:cytochrome c peroxidase
MASKAFGHEHPPFSGGHSTMHVKSWLLCAAVLVPSAGFASPETLVDSSGHTVVLQAGHASLAKWLLPAEIPSPADNRLTPERAELGRKLFFDPRLSATGQSTCASCHFPERGWADGFPTSVRLFGEQMSRASPSLVNVAYNNIHLWDGRSPTLEHQAVNGISLTGSMNAGAAKDAVVGVEVIKKVAGYQQAFQSAYPGEPITAESIAKALASFERTLVSRDSPFDRWVKGDSAAMNASQVRGLRVFLDPAKGNCAVCHAAPNFTDNGFHNLGLKSFGKENPDPGRFKQQSVEALLGAFRTPTLRDIALTAPYFHDGSARTLTEVIEHYARGGEVRNNLSPLIKPLALTAQDKADLVDFMRTLTTPPTVFRYPVLPQ